tara:strand:- start:9446 stop:11662 length:2217 start_codon:yes stop_codon:yes gene_type:complete
MLRNPGLRKSVEQPVLDLNFAASQIGSNAAPDSRIDFSRGSNAWFVDSDGLVKKSPHNLVLQSEDLTTNWSTFQASIVANAAASPTGELTADKVVTNNSANICTCSQSIASLDDSTVFVFSGYVKAAELTVINLQFYNKANTFHGSGNFDLTNGTRSGSPAAGTESSIENVGNGWYRITFSGLNTGTGGQNPNFRFVCNETGDGSKGFLVWGAQVSQHTTLPVDNPYIKTTGSAVYAARLDHDPATNTPKGLLIEEARTNLVDDSEDFTSSQITAVRLTLTANSSTAPNGTNTATEAVPNTDNNTHLIRWDDSVTSGKTYTASVFVKQASGDANIRLLFNNLNSGFVFSAADFDLSAGTVNNLSCNSASIEEYGNGWFRCSISETATASVTGRVQLNVSDSSGSSSYAGDGTTGVFIWGFQIEEGSFPTSYIQTTGSTATRNADVATMGPTTGGTELVTNGTFDTDVSNWNASNSTLSHQSGKLRVTSTGGDYPMAIQTLTTVIGRRYRLTADVIVGNTPLGGVVQVNAETGQSFTASGGLITSNSTVTIDFTANITNVNILLHGHTGTSAGQYQEFDNVSVRELYPFEQYRPDQGTMVVAFDTQSDATRGPWWFSRGGISSTGWGLRFQLNSKIDSMVRDSSNFNSLDNLTITPDFDIVAASYEQRASDTFCSVATATNFDDDGHVNDIDVSVDTLDIGQCKVGGSNTGISSGHIKRLQYFPIAMNDETKLKNMCDD